MNPLQPHYDQCNTGTNRGKWDALPDFPHMLDIEVTSACNFRCLMCPVGNLSMTRPADVMTQTTWDNILDIALGEAEHEVALRFIGWGEPLLHPNIFHWVDEAESAGAPCHINTNGSKLTTDLANDLVEAGLTSIKFSFQGVDRESYQDMRNTDFYDGMLEAIRLMRAARAGLSLPYIAASTSITDESPERVERFKQEIGPLVDHLSIGNTIFDYFDASAVRLKPEDIERLERLKLLESGEKRHPNPCPEVFDKLSIHADGSVVVCCNDYNGTVTLGNVNETPIAELWRHPKIEAYRKRLSEGEYSGPLCTHCYDYQDLTNGEEHARSL